MANGEHGETMSRGAAPASNRNGGNVVYRSNNTTGPRQVRDVPAPPVGYRRGGTDLASAGDCLAHRFPGRRVYEFLLQRRDGVMVLACSGHLRFAAATSDAIKKLIEWYGESPGFFDGDQLFFNDPYIAGAHTYDMMIVKPIFHEGALIGWACLQHPHGGHWRNHAGIGHGDLPRGHKNSGPSRWWRRGEFREDVFRCITEQCRDPGYVGPGHEVYDHVQQRVLPALPGAGAEVWAWTSFRWPARRSLRL